MRHRFARKMAFLRQTKFVHEFCTFLFGDFDSFDVWLFYQNTKLTILVLSKAYNLHIGIGEDCIMNDYPVKREAKDVIMLQRYELSYKPTTMRAHSSTSAS